MLFFRSTTDGQHIDCSETLKDLYASTSPSACIVLGASPIDLNSELCDAVRDSSLPVIGCNLAGRDKTGQWWKKPTIWTAFDPSSRFPRSIYTDPAIMKFVNGHRTADLVSDGDEKMCEMPNIFFYHNEYRSYTNFFDPSNGAINHSLDTFIQALDIGFMLGFREFICVGTEMAVRPSEAQIRFAEQCGVRYDRETFETITERTVSEKHVEFRSDLFRDFVRAIAKAKFNGEDKQAIAALNGLEREDQYSFNETKSLEAVSSSDAHYFERVQYLRLSRRTMARHGMVLYSTSPTSRLSAYFPVIDGDCIQQYEKPRTDDLRGLYSGRDLMKKLPFHKDVKPYSFPDYLANRSKPCCGGCAEKKQQHPVAPVENAGAAPIERDGMVLKQLEAMKVAPVEIREEM